MAEPNVPKLRAAVKAALKKEGIQAFAKRAGLARGTIERFVYNTSSTPHRGTLVVLQGVLQ
jgi:hypothetical protein